MKRSTRSRRAYARPVCPQEVTMAKMRAVQVARAVVRLSSSNAMSARALTRKGEGLWQKKTSYAKIFPTIGVPRVATAKRNASLVPWERPSV